MSAETIFSKIIRREIPAQIVFESEAVLAFRDVSPQAPTHVLIVPKKPLKDLLAAGKDDAGIAVQRRPQTRQGVGVDEGIVVEEKDQVRRERGQRVLHAQVVATRKAQVFTGGQDGQCGKARVQRRDRVIGRAVIHDDDGGRRLPAIRKGFFT